MKIMAVDAEGDFKNLTLIGFVSEPWMLTGVSCIAVNPDVDYVLMRLKEERVLVSKAFYKRNRSYFQEYFQVGFIRGGDLMGVGFTHQLTSA